MSLDLPSQNKWQCEVIFCVRLEITSQQWVRQVNEMYVQCQLCTVHRQCWCLWWNINALQLTFITRLQQIGYVELEDRIINKYSVQHQTLNWTKKLFCSFLDMNTINSFPLLMTCRTKVTHGSFRLGLASIFNYRVEVYSFIK